MAFALAGAIWSGGAPLPTGNSSPEQARALVQRAAEYLQQHGSKVALVEFNKPRSPFNTFSEWNPNGDMYLVMYWANRGGVQLVHGRHPQMAGKDMSNLTNVDGVAVTRELIKACNAPAGYGWVNYKWGNQVTHQFAMRRTYIQKVDEYCIGAGVFID